MGDRAGAPRQSILKVRTAAACPYISCLDQSACYNYVLPTQRARIASRTCNPGYTPPQLHATGTALVNPAQLPTLQEPVVLRKGRDVAAEAVVSAEAAQEVAAEIQAEEVLPKIARKGGHPNNRRLSVDMVQLSQHYAGNQGDRWQLCIGGYRHELLIGTGVDDTLRLEVDAEHLTHASPAAVAAAPPLAEEVTPPPSLEPSTPDFKGGLAARTHVSMAATPPSPLRPTRAGALNVQDVRMSDRLGSLVQYLR